MEAIASRTNGGLYIDVNTKMLDTTLCGKVSSMVKTEVQEIEIASTVVPETTVRYFFLLEVNLFFIGNIGNYIQWYSDEKWDS